MINKRILFIGYGNPARGDDGLGAVFAQQIEAMSLPGVTVETNYQLCVEDALTASEYDQVIFADASISGEKPFDYFELDENSPCHFSTHSVSPGTVIHLAKLLFDATTQGFVVAIRGYCFDPYTETLSDQAEKNLEQAVQYVSGLYA